MLKYVESAITFTEFPDEIALCLNLSLCPNHCQGCSEQYLAGDVGEELTFDLIDSLIKKNPGITLIGFMGGDNDHSKICELSAYIHKEFGLKVGVYSGQEYLDMDLLDNIDYYKIGKWIMPTGPASDWHMKNCGPLKFPFSNQLMFKKNNKRWENITKEFRKEIIHNYEKEIVK